MWISIKKVLTYDEVKKIEKKLNIRLPEDYCNIIGSINGGALKKGFYLHSKLGKIPYSRNLNLCQSAKINAIDMFDILDCGSHKYFPFGSVGNGDYYCFDLKNQKVVLFEHESGKVYGICNTYTELIKGIVFDEE